jgi:drug/metabolite transporter (DMT)-like permease
LKASSKAHIAAITTNLLFAGNYSLVKYISPSMVKPYGLNFLRVGVSLILMWISWLLDKGSVGILKKHFWRFFFCGLMGVAINQNLFIKGLTMTSTIHASLLMLSSPILITLFAFFALNEKVTGIKIGGLLLGIGGSVILIMSRDNVSIGNDYLIGDLLILANAVSYSIYFILVKPLMEEYPPMHVIRWVFTFGMLFNIPLGWNEVSSIEWQHFDWFQIISLAFIVVGGTFLAYIFTVYSIKHIGSAVTGSYIYTQPILVVLIATLFLSEMMTLEKVMAGLMIFLGVYLVSFRKTNR